MQDEQRMRDHAQREEQIERLQKFSEFVWEGRQRGLSRREFLRCGLAAGLSLPAIAAILVGCGVDQTAAVPTATPTNIPTAVPPTATSEPTIAPTATNTAIPDPTATSEPTATPQPRQALFAIIGDFGWAGPEEESVANLIKGWGVDFIVTTGDNNYPTGNYTTIDKNIGQYYHEYMRHTTSEYGPMAERNRFWPVIGNHDTDIDLGQPYFDYFVLPGNERYYLVEEGPVRIFAVNSVPWIEEDGVHPDSMQAIWLRDQLAASPDTWNLIFFHHPAYSSGYKGPSTWMRWPFQEWGAHAVFNGHNHVYERIMINGFPYFTNGLGGGPRYAFDVIDPNSQSRFNMEHGAQRVEATDTAISIAFITASGEVIETYEMTKDA